MYFLHHLVFFFLSLLLLIFGGFLVWNIHTIIFVGLIL